MFLTFYILQAGPPKCCGTWSNLSPYFPIDGSGCVNNMLRNAFKKLTQCVNAL